MHCSFVNVKSSDSKNNYVTLQVAQVALMYTASKNIQNNKEAFNQHTKNNFNGQTKKVKGLEF
ncbi:hypothetical protein Sjap_023521 [Stephania japonica]|uniref:Uncharacterized protein n=1 Tax=Stephania japonica TaxID=461633 RepID=A0AAP0HKJ6_9MAGN